ncbi:MAG: glucokinase [Acidobacteria bacterium]|nr:glucokinase [Acidobacteriota bacterium]MCL5286892.1 glucokinase [Acidobacteriota bacterium]
MILAGDIGATNTRLALFRREGAGEIRTSTPRVADGTFISRKSASLREIVRDFVAISGARVSRACFGIAGPIRDRRCVATNLPWVVEADALATELHLSAEQVLLINDLEANAYGVDGLAASDLATINEGARGAQGNAALISAGTGLGEAGLFWDGHAHRAFACEGGHSSFAPTTALHLELHQWLLKKFPHVSWERILSGPGLVNLFEFLRDTGRGEQPAWLAEEMRQSDPAPVISRHALAGKSPLCEKALELFVELYGAEAGNVALKFLATGGVYVGGGIAPRILPKLQTPAFREAFLAKGRMRPLLESMPLRIILNERAALVGAARRALMDG